MPLITYHGWPRVAAFLSLALLVGCTDELPTVGGSDRFPDGRAPTTIELLLTGGDVLLQEAVYDDFADPRNAAYLLVAEDFDGELDAHTLTRFRNFPQAVTFSSGGTTRTDSVFDYVSGEVTTVVNPNASTEAVTTLRLWAVEQAWDSTQVTWQNAAEGEPWAMPGGTRGDLLAEAQWMPGDTVVGDTVIWQLDSLAVRRLAAEGSHGVMVTSADADTRLQIRGLSLRTRLRPESVQDTTIAVAVATGAQVFVFSPEPPRSSGIYRVGGVTGARTVLELDLIQDVPGCSAPTVRNCEDVSLRDVTLNYAELVLQPRPVPAGFRPLNTSSFLIRRVVEPELGRQSPLGQALVSDTVSAARFEVGSDEPVRVNLTSAIQTLIQTDSTSLTVALLGDGSASQFGYQWYEGVPVVRLVYTLPLIQRLP